MNTASEKRESELLRKREQYYRNKEAIAARTKAAREQDPEKFRERVRRYKANNYAKVLAKQRAYDLTRREKRNKQKRKEYAENKAIFQKKRRDWYANNKDRAAKADAKYIASNRAKVRTRKATYYRANKEKSRAYDQKRYRENRDERIRYSKEYREAHPEKTRAASHIRRARQGKVPIGDLKRIEKWEAAWKKKRIVTCYWCQNDFPPKECEMDHIVPIRLSGPHEIGNLVVSCRGCNRRKTAKPLTDWNGSLASPTLF